MGPAGRPTAGHRRCGVAEVGGWALEAGFRVGETPMRGIASTTPTLTSNSQPLTSSIISPACLKPSHYANHHHADTAGAAGADAAAPSATGVAAAAGDLQGGGQLRRNRRERDGRPGELRPHAHEGRLP